MALSCRPSGSADRPGRTRPCRGPAQPLRGAGPAATAGRGRLPPPPGPGPCCSPPSRTRTARPRRSRRPWPTTSALRCPSSSAGPCSPKGSCGGGPSRSEPPANRSRKPGRSSNGSALRCGRSEPRRSSPVLVSGLPRPSADSHREAGGRTPAAGRTNPEIAQAMFLSVHTVEDNLRRVYGKLGIRSRTELAAKSRTLLPTPRCRGPCLASAQVIPPPFRVFPRIPRPCSAPYPPR